MGACFRFGECRRAKPPAALAGDGDFAPAILCAAKAAHRKGGEQLRCLPALYAQRSHTEKRRLDGWHTEKATARLLCAKAAHRKG